MSSYISQNLRCEIDSCRDDRKREAPHCHITKGGRRVAQVFLEPSVNIARGHDLDRSEVNTVYDYCSDNRSSLIDEYREGL